MEKIPAVFCWSGGKDSSLALYRVLKEGKYDVKYLLTTLNEEFKRISMHGVREELLNKQADSIGMPLVKVWVREGTNEEYERQMAVAMERFRDESILQVIHGDIFLEDLRKYREEKLERAGMKGVFPLWKEDTSLLIQEFLALGFKTITCCISDSFLTESDVGKVIDNQFIKNLPSKVDPCGENGEFHTFCYAGPIFEREISFSVGEKVYKPLQLEGSKHGFWYCDLV